MSTYMLPAGNCSTRLPLYSCSGSIRHSRVSDKLRIHSGEKHDTQYVG